MMSKVILLEGVFLGGVNFSSGLFGYADSRVCLLASYFANFYGREECGISSLDLYKAPVIEGTGKPQRNAYCQTREALLEAMSTGVRYDLDTPFVSSGKSPSLADSLHCLAFWNTKAHLSQVVPICI